MSFGPIDSGSFDLAVVGTGFASTFFLLRTQQNTQRRLRILVLERGREESHAERIANRQNWSQAHGIVSSTPYQPTFLAHGIKDWVYTPALGGGSNCWWACTPRMLPSDFRLKSLYGIGRDWPLNYNDLERYYGEAEAIMQISGGNPAPFPMSRSYPQPPHRFNRVDNLLSRHYPGQYFHQPNARARLPTARRPACCASAVCNLCPTDAKFSISNEMHDLYTADNITLITGAQALSFETQRNSVTSILFEKDGQQFRAYCDQLALGANAIFNPHIMLSSGLTDPLIGRNLVEQVSLRVCVLLRDIRSLDGSTSITGHGYMLYDGKHRSNHAACLMENYNSPRAIRPERGKHTAVADLKFIFEELPDPGNRVMLSKDSRKPSVVFERYSSYLQRSATDLRNNIDDLLSALPVEGPAIVENEFERTEAHILGTTVMGRTPQDSVVDRNLIHHRLRNLLVLGGSAFPTASPANPSLTIAALSLRAADQAYR